MSINRDIYNPVRDDDDIMQLASSPRLTVPFAKKPPIPQNPAQSLLTEAMNSVIYSSVHSGIDDTHYSSLSIEDEYVSYNSMGATMNPILLKKLQERQQSVLMLEITSDGGGDYKVMSLRDLLIYINNLATDIETRYFQKLKRKSVRDINSTISDNNNNNLNSNIINNSSSNLPGIVTHSQTSFRVPLTSTQSGRATPSNSAIVPIPIPTSVDEESNNNNNSNSTNSNGSRGEGTSPQYQEQKSEPGAQYLRHRDLRRLEFHFNPLGEPTIIVRRHAVLVSLDPLRAIIMADRLILIIPDGMDSVLEIFDKALNAWSDSDSLPFEARAYEGVFSTIIAIQTEEYEVFNRKTLEILTDYKNASIISIDKQEQLRLLKNKVTSMLVKISAYKHVIEELLDEDHDMALMNLTRLKRKPILYQIPLSFEILSTHEEIEVLLESYLVDYNYLESKLNFLKSQILSAEELVLLRLDTSRNQLLIADTIIAIVACCVGFGSFIGSIFGMNLKNYHEQDTHTFHIVTSFTLIGISALAVSVILLLRCLGVIPHEYLSLSFYTTITQYTNDAASKLAASRQPVLPPQSLEGHHRPSMQREPLEHELR